MDVGRREDLEPYEAEVEWVLRKLRTRLTLLGDTRTAAEVHRIWNTAAAPGQAAQDTYDLLRLGGRLSSDDPLLRRLLAAIPWREEDPAAGEP